MRLPLIGLLALISACSFQPEQAYDTSGDQVMIDGHRYQDSSGAIRVSLVKQPYHGGRNTAELSRNPDYLEEGGIAETLAEAGYSLGPLGTVGLTAEEAGEYGEWHRLGLANGHLAEYVGNNERSGYVTVGLLANCNALIGMLGGFQNSGPGEAKRTVGLVWVDAHGDFNTPETTLSGMLGGMPVAVSAGLALDRLRRESHLDPAISPEHIVMVAVRDTDPEEQELIEEHELAMISAQDVRDISDALHAEMERLSSEVDLIYVHIDMDVLDPGEVQGHGLTVPDGPTSGQLAAALTEIFKYPRVAGLGIASTPAYDLDPGELSRRAAYRLIQGALEGVAER
jgi:arginase